MPRREFLYSDDMADACIYLLEQPDAKLQSLFSESHPPLINIGCGEDLTIRDLAEMAREVAGFKGQLVFDTSKPDGTKRKLMDVSRIKALGWERKIGLNEGIALAYQDMRRRLEGQGEVVKS